MVLRNPQTLLSIAISVYLLNTHITGSQAAVFQHISEVSTTVYDFVVVGGGAGGAVVANRLTENPEFDVLLIEAGPTNEGVTDAIIPSLYRSLEKTAYDWNYTTVPIPAVNNRSLDYPKGFILGGCTSHNGMYYTRGSMDDYNRWAEVTGDEGWAWNNLLPYIFKTEKLTPPSDLHDTRGQITPSLHGKNGLVFTTLPSNPETIDEMVINATRELPGLFPFVEDYNNGRPMGLGWLQATMGNGTRSSSATAFLSETFTRRPNLSVLLNTKVTRVLASGTSTGSHVTFDTVEIQGSTIKFAAKKEIILSAGTVNTPQILLNSGVGDREELKKLNIKTVLNLPSVGKNMTEQPLVTVLYAVNSDLPADNINTNTTLQAEALAQWEFNRTGPFVDLSSNFVAWSRLPHDSPVIKQFGDPSAGPNSPHIESFPLSAITQPGQPGHFGTVELIIVSPSSRGSVTLNPSDHFGHPLIDTGLLTSPFDIHALVSAIRLGESFYTAPTFKNYIVSQLSPAPNATDAELVEFIRSTVAPAFHGVGTAGMAARGSGYGVVDPDLKVKGAVGLRIVDASVMPFITSGHTQAPVYAIAERASDLIKQSWT